MSDDLDYILVSVEDNDRVGEDQTIWAEKSLDKLPLYSVQSVKSKALQPNLAEREKLGLKAGDRLHEVTTTIRNVGNLPSDNAGMKVFLYDPDAESFILDLLEETFVLQPKETMTLTRTVIVGKEQIDKMAPAGVNKKVKLGVLAEEAVATGSDELLVSDSQSTYISIDTNQVEDIQMTQNGNALADLEMQAGQSVVLKGQILSEQSSAKNILTWESSNSRNVSLSTTSEGECILHANNEGIATITVTAYPYGYKKQLQISVSNVPGIPTIQNANRGIIRRTKRVILRQLYSFCIGDSN